MEIKEQIKLIWPELSEFLINPDLASKLETEGIKVNWKAIDKLSKEFGINIAVCADDRVRVSKL